MAAITVKVTIIGQLDKSGHLDAAKKESYIITLADQDKSIWYTRIIHIIYARGSWLSMATVGLDCLKLHWVDSEGDCITIRNNADMDTCVRLNGRNLKITVNIEPRIAARDKTTLCDRCKVDIAGAQQAMEDVALNDGHDDDAEAASANRSSESVESDDSVVNYLINTFKKANRNNVVEPF